MEPAVPRATTAPAESPAPDARAGPDRGDGGGRHLTRPTPRAALTLATAALVIVVLLAAFGAVKPFILGIVLVYLLAPLVDRLVRVGVPRWLAVLVAFLLVIAVIVVLMTVSLSPLVAQLQQFLKDLPTIVEDARPALADFYGGLNLSPEIRASVDSILAEVATGAGGVDIGAVVRPVLESVFSVVGAVTAYAILPAWLYFLLKDRPRLADSLERALPASWRADVFAIFAMTDRVFGNWIRGQLVLGATVGVFSFVGLELLAVVVDPVFGRYAILLALIAGLLELVPFIGPIIAAVPAILVGLTAGPQGFLAAFLLYLLIQQVENNVLVPKIQGDAVELHPSAVMLALVVGASLAGILGAIISLPVAAAGRDVFRYLFKRVSEPPATVVEALTSVSPKLLKAIRPSALAWADPAAGRPADAPTTRPAERAERAAS